MTADEASEVETDRYRPRLVEIRPAYRQFFAEGGRRAIFVLHPQDAAAPAPGGGATA